MSSSWGCPHEIDGACHLTNNPVPCEPGMKGCILYGRFVFADSRKNASAKKKRTKSSKANHSKKTSLTRKK